MTWMLWWIGVVGLLLAAALALRVTGAMRWADLIRRHTGQLEAACVVSNGSGNGSGSGIGQVQSISSLPVRFDAQELEGLPAPVQRYFRAVLKNGQPLIAEATIAMTGTMNMSATGQQWKPFTSEQRVTTRRPGFLWDAKVMMFAGVPVRVEDSYIAGQGRLTAKLLGVFTLANVHGGGDIARGELMRYFAEAAWYPTALLPSQGVRWVAVDDASASATLVDGPITLSLLFRFAPAGLIASVHADARGAGSGDPLHNSLRSVIKRTRAVCGVAFFANSPAIGCKRRLASPSRPACHSPAGVMQRVPGKNTVMLPWECRLSHYQWHHNMLVPMTGEAAYVRPEGRNSYFVGNVKTLSCEFCS
jgi:hypothetical protein